MPFPMRIQPLDSKAFEESIRNESPATKPPVLKWRLKRLFDRQFPSVLRTSSVSVEKPPPPPLPSATSEFEPSSVCLAKMVQNFIEENNEKASATAKCGRNRCNCFNGNNNSDISDDEFDISSGFGDSINQTTSAFDPLDVLKSLIPCASVAERNLLADTSKIVEKNKNCKRKDDLRKIVSDELLLLHHNASICKSRWDKSPSYPAGEYEYIDVIVEGGERVLIDIDFRSEFEIARSTGNYKSVLQFLPYIFVGKSDRLQQIVSIVSEAARQSLKKKGMPVPPWRKAEYMRAKWLSPHSRTAHPEIDGGTADEAESDCGELELIFGETESPATVEDSGEQEKMIGIASPWQPPAIKPKSCERGAKVVTGLASLLTEKP